MTEVTKTPCSRLRSACLGMAMLATLGSAGAVLAQSVQYPVRPIHFLVPYGPAGGPDLLARNVSRKLPDLAGQTVVIDNRPGASGLVGTGLAAQAPNDGYTVLIGDSGPLTIAPSLQKSLAFNPEKDFIPVAMGMTAPIFFAVNANVPVKDMKGLAAFLTANPKLSYGSTGVGSVHHLGMALFLSMTKTTMTHIPYNSQVQSVPALLNSDIPLLMIAYTSIRPHVESGRVRVLAVATKMRAPFAPNVPTVAESYPGYEVRIDVGFLVPAGTSRDIVNRLNGWIRTVLAMPDVAQTLTNSGAIPVLSTPEEYDQMLRADREKFRKLIIATGAKAE